MSFLRFKATSLATAVLLLAPTLGFGQSCLVVGPGTWTGSEPSEFWSLPHAIRLTNAVESHLVGRRLGGREGWRTAEVLVDSQPWEGELGWSWVKPASDSLVILRPAMLSEGIEFRLAGHADTLVGRAFAFSDAVGQTNPRANAYGIGFDCVDREAREAAFEAYRRMKESDLPDPERGALEDSLRWEAIQQRLKALRSEE